MNDFCREIKKILPEVENILICLQKGNDLDTASSSLGLAKLLETNYPNLKLIKLLQVNVKSTFLPDIENYQYKEEDKFDPEKTLFISLDINSKNQILPETYKLIKNCSYAIKIDHHEDSESIANKDCKFKEISLVKAEYNSCAEIIWNLAIKMKWKKNKEIATILFHGLYADSINLTSEQVSWKTFKIMSQMAKNDVEIPKIIRKMNENDIKQIKIIGKLIENLSMYENLAFLNLNPELVYEYYPQNFKITDKKKIAQKKLLTFPLNIIESLLKANTIIYVHYCLISPFNNDKKYVFIVLTKPNKKIEQLLLEYDFKKHRNRFSRPMKFSELLNFLNINRELLSE